MHPPAPGTPEDHQARAAEAARRAHKWAVWAHRGSTIELWLYLAPILVAALCLCCGCGYVFFRS